jgi:hypothetical protein
MYYTDQTRVEAYLKRELTEEEITILDEVIAYVSSFIDGNTNRTWLSVDTEQDEIDDIESDERIYDGSGGKELFIEDSFIALESIKILDYQGNVSTTFSQESDWLLYPLNKNPKQSIVLRTSFFPWGAGRVAITAIWGDGIVPDDIVIVCTTLVGKYLQKAENSSGLYKKESIEGYSYETLTADEMDKDTDKTMETISKWKKYLL